MLLQVAFNNIDSQAKSIAQELNIDDSTQQIAKQQAFIILKDHEDNFASHPTCRFINPVQSELGKVSKQILDNINSQIRKTTKLNQWKNTSDVTNWLTWFTCKSIRSYRSPCAWHFQKMRAVLTAQNPTHVSSENSLKLDWLFLVANKETT